VLLALNAVGGPGVSGKPDRGKNPRIFTELMMSQGVRQERRSTEGPLGAHAQMSEEELAPTRGTVTPIERPSAPRRKARKTPTRPRILVIEDDPYAREALSLLLDYYGYDVVAASNGADGLELVTDAAPDLVVTDWRMPGLSGLALCVALRERRNTMPIIVVTSAEEVFSQDQPVNARLRKPIDPRLLNQVINDELRSQRRP
jgi:CheY-like chemotaxis protein